MAPRRSHCKSRHGCMECKRRRVKCDELRPVCTNCSKRHAKCKYGAASSLLWANEGPSSHEGSTSSQIVESLLAPTSTFWDPVLLNGEATADFVPPNLNLIDLELQMQWFHETYRVFSRNERTDPVWQSLVPREALSQPFLMHGILAISALHLAQTREDNARSTYLKTAVAHQNRALALFRGLLGDINPSNAKAMFAFASIVAIYGFAYPQEPATNDPWTTVDSLYQVLILVRGVQQVVNSSSSSLLESNFSSLLQWEDCAVSLPDDAKLAFQQLQKVNDTCDAQGLEQDATVYSEVITKLEETLCSISSGGTSMSAACRLAIRFPSKYVDCLQERKPLALVLLLFYCVILHRLRSNWVFDKWGARVAKAIWIVLDARWKPMAHWAMLDIFGDASGTEMELV